MAKEKLALKNWLHEATTRKITFSELLLEKNAQELDVAKSDVVKQMLEMLEVMKSSAEYGLSGVHSRSNLTGGNAKKLLAARQNASFKNLLGDLVGDAVTYALAVAEANAAMGRIVAAPTAGASGVLPGALLAVQKNYNLTDEKLAEGLVVAGGIGLVIAERASLSGAMGGCQAETGSAAAMTAGALVDMFGGTPDQVGQAIAIAIKNMLGLVCDPVAGLVEVPCVKRNAGAVVQALLAAELALAGVSSFIPADEVIDAMQEVGERMHCSLKETADGGLACSPTALAWTKVYFNKNEE
ncbi:MAG TPA: L-serine ammonia-lyase, iron-sulfur-dependent, subunit alpha [Candidatus Avacidaminococcus intestinavium]|uniref:L-serine dehydratase n=1 Tax=Candidatus Avacidaminococcus intestinavium TaxID=2840684 RepID=A0A9D1MPH3_9FIRM|nr:L-serine ammonia-lyase, iron-sulfur-dependent, subunit alpha [Candidatus Avacidaminococcus intestinavium]